MQKMVKQDQVVRDKAKAVVNVEKKAADAKTLNKLPDPGVMPRQVRPLCHRVIDDKA
ncbi:hypothetical protein NOC27_2800 [Nitrosococcus oceani AFC27]|uniref:hypothetical protein n=1 Tax=Nitrosococcus oceani TaxID=1229 RepID=UPI000183C243|nr:hypothetical protein [Nitrosococcus oceani]EDZ66120.1 hypothetical protein NOC27_2800 [Nitrosococcus oceani AFC27]GEM20070.1 hypothetical protein NONS58_14760 [Nitrosococcus oceani]